jgi:hypothetical protein
VPKGDASDSKTLQRFARAVLAVQPNATGEAIEIYEWGRTVTIAIAELVRWRYVLSRSCSGWCYSELGMFW